MMNRTNNLTGHGSAYDRGSADRYYRRSFKPHYYTGPSYGSKLVEEKDMTPEEVAAYRQGWNEQDDFKEWD